MGLPNILIEFKSKASTAIKRGERGIVAVMLIEAEKDAGVTKVEDVTQIPEGLTEDNKAYLERAFYGGSMRLYKINSSRRFLLAVCGCKYSL